MSPDSDRLSLIEQASIVVVKVGTNVLADATGKLDSDRIRSLSQQLHNLQQSGRRVCLVSSGAIGAGVGRLQLNARPTDLPHLQACAAVGQSALMQHYQEALSPFGIHAAQILLTASDFDGRARYLNMRNTITTLFEYPCLPIVNENDTVSVSEIKFGDNDQLAAMVANLLRAPLLVLLTNVDGLYTGDPKNDANAQLLSTVPQIDRSVTGFAATTKSQLGTGGMRSKLRASRIATAAGCGVIMANGASDGVLQRIFAGEPVGTLFLPHSQPLPSWKRWLGYTARPKGNLILDSGACQAVVKQGKSLLPVGVRGVAGQFGKGDVVALMTADGTEIGRGLCNYSSADAARIAGLNREQLTAVLGTVPYDELVHRDNLVIIA
jgi:glutamate 5-kinase